MPRSRTLPKQSLLRKIRIILTDVDGVQTDGIVRFSDTGETAVSFSIQDGFMVWVARKAGLSFGWISGRYSPAVEQRGRQLGIDFLELGTWSKKESFLRWQKKYNWQQEETLFIGDDLNDLPVFPLVGISVAVANARPEVKKKAMWQLSQRGGEGAVRYVIEKVLQAQNKWKAVQEAFS